MNLCSIGTEKCSRPGPSTVFRFDHLYFINDSNIDSSSGIHHLNCGRCDCNIFILIKSDIVASDKITRNPLSFETRVYFVSKQPEWTCVESAALLLEPLQ